MKTLAEIKLANWYHANALKGLMRDYAMFYREIISPNAGLTLESRGKRGVYALRCAIHYRDLWLKERASLYEVNNRLAETGSIQ